MMIGRSRPLAAVIAARSAGIPSSRRWRSPKLTSMIAFETATPTAMIAPMNDSMFRVVPRDPERQHDAAEDRRHRRHGRQGQPGGLEVGGQHDQDHDHGHAQADLQALEHLLHRPDLAAQLDLGPPGRPAGAGDRRVEPVDHAAEVFALDVGGQAQVAPHVVAVDLAGHLAAHDAGHVADQQRRRGVGGRVGPRRRLADCAWVVSGTSATSVASVIFGGGTCTWTWYELPLTSSRQ